MRAADLYHVGIVTDDLEATRDEMSELFGYEWAPGTSASTPVCTAGVDSTVDLELLYSRTAPRVELVRTVPGTVWTPAAGSGIHHLGYWSDDVPADAADLERRGYATEVLGRGPGGSVPRGYFRSGDGLRVELVSRALQAAMERSWAATP